MTFTECVTEITSRLNLTSSEATTRVGRLVNRQYKIVTAEIGISSAVRRSLAASQAMSIGSAECTFSSMQQITRVYYLSGTKKVFLDAVTLDEIQDESELPTSDTPQRWAIKAIGATTVTVKIDALAESTYALKADGYATVSTLSGSDVPAFPEIYHDILVEGVLEGEYSKKEKLDLAAKSKALYDLYLGKLKMWNAKNAYLRIRQGERDRTAIPFISDVN